MQLMQEMCVLGRSERLPHEHKHETDECSIAAAAMKRRRAQPMKARQATQATQPMQATQSPTQPMQSISQSSQSSDYTIITESELANIERVIVTQGVTTTTNENESNN